METNVTACKKCLLRDMDQTEVFHNMYEYIANLDQEDKVTEEQYEQRLAICRTCDWLLSGMCRVCGCYVEMRAAMKIRHCPNARRKW